jgi:hypothetical protein
VIVSIIDCIEEFARLGKEGTDLAIIPSGDDALAVSHKLNREAFKPWDLNSEKLLTCLHVPDTNVVKRAGSEELRVLNWECNSINALVVASVTELRVDLIAIAPVDSGLGSAAEEVGGISSHCDGSNSSHDLGLRFDKHVFSTNLSNGSISSSNDEVIVCK